MASQPPMIKPQQIDSLPHLDAAQKQTYKQGLMNLWNIHDNSPEGSAGRNEARQKIASASQKIMQQLNRASRPVPNAAAQQGQQRPPQAAQGGQAQQAGGQGQQNPQQMQQPQQQQAQQGQATQQPQQQQQPQQTQQAPQQQATGPTDNAQLQAKVKQMVHNIVVFPEPNTPNAQQFEQYKANYQQSLGNSLMKRERSRAEIPRLEGLEAQMKSQGSNLSDEMQNRLNTARTVLAEASRQVAALEQKNEQNKLSYQQKQQKQKEQQQQQQQASQNMPQANGQPMPNPQINGAQAQAMQRTNSQQAQANVTDVNKPTNSPAPPQQFAQQGQQTPQAGTPVQQQQQMPPQQQQQQQQPRPQPQMQPQGTPQSASQPQQQFPQNNMAQQQNQQQRPAMNQQQPQQHPQYGVQQQQQQQPQQQQAPQQQQQYQQTPQPGMQQNAMPNQQPQRPQALTQRDAMAQAAQSYTQQQQQPPGVNQAQQPMQQQHSNMPNGLPFNQPQSAQQHTPTSGFPPNQQMSSAQTKFPIPKELRMDPRTQTPVPGPPSRPTMMGQGGMMNVPGVQKPAHFTLEGEGDHVLSKRKLDELVRQITGSTSQQDGLSPEVEEAVLSLTDNFVDNVIQKACQLAKLRQGQTLDVKDVQMVLERNYGIRIPGYSLDELRTVRKFQPAPGWVGKVQAVQAGKVMGGNKDA
ncbi:hypothetical protein WHR41_07430 [Cladosporium halotolerans]|uniref:Transcription initiation factor TFIID subunit 12 domain-containing protein n=1 Tax=Cladosporium halotolerans TaxID=1052096 RepID=A0AB34KJ01_9PEZI